MISLRHCMFFLMGIPALSGFCPAQPAPIIYNLNIDAQPIDDALNEFARQSGLQVVLQTEEARGIISPRLAGRYSSEAALDQLLANTSLSYEFLNTRTVAIRQRPEERVEATSGSSSTTSTLEGNRIHLAQAGAVAEQAAGTQEGQSQNDPEKSNDSLELEEVVVTGTHIRGAQTFTGSRAVYDRAALDRAGYGSTQEFIRSLPQNFKGGTSGASEDGPLNGSDGAANIESASGVNLRGLGSNSTLVLLNGHRVAPAAYGQAVDISMIPLEAIERIEVLTDGASAIYGADAVGGVVNFTLRKNYQGAETTFRGGSVTDGGRSEYVVGQTLGQQWNSGNALVTLQYREAGNLRASERDFTADVVSPTDLYPAISQYSGIANLRQQLTNRLDVFADGIYNYQAQSRISTSPSRTQDNDVYTNSFTGNVGLGWQLADDWRVEAGGLFSQTYSFLKSYYTPASAAPAGYVNGEPALRNLLTYTEGSIKADGSLFELPAGKLKAAFGASHRVEDFSSLEVYLGNDRPYERDVDSVFAELYVPVLPALDLSVAARYDDYDRFGDSTNPKYGLRWTPFPDLNLWASHGTSFRAPNAWESINAGAAKVVFGFPGFALPEGGTAASVLVVGSQGELVPEESRNTTVGFEYRPHQTPGVTLSAAYFEIDYRNRIITPPPDFGALLQPDVYGSLITRFADDAAAATFLTDLSNQGYEFLDLSEDAVGTTGVRYAYQIGLTNAARVRQNGFDLGASYSLATAAGQLQFAANAAAIRELLSAFCGSCTTIDLSNTYGQPLRWQARGEASWTRGMWQLNGSLNYKNSYRDTTIVPSGRIGSYTTVDLNARYSPTQIAGLTLGVNVINLFDSDPPSTAGSAVGSPGVRYDVANADPLGRMISAQVRVTW